MQLRVFAMQKRTTKNASPFHMAFSDGIHLEILRHIQEGIGDMRPHTHNRMEIAVCQCNGGHLLMDGEIFPVCRGDIILVYAGTVHDIRCTTEDDSWSYLFLDIPHLFRDHPDKNTLCSLTDITQFRSHICSPEEKEWLLPCIHRIMDLYQDTDPEPDSSHHLVSYIACLLYETKPYLLPSDPATAMVQGQPAARLHVAHPAMSYIFRHYAEPITTKDLCECCFVSPPHLRRVFKAAFGHSPMEVVHIIRVRYASKALIETKQPIITIAVQHGFSTLSSFNRQFLKIMHMTPSQYRENHSSR